LKPVARRHGRAEFPGEKEVLLNSGRVSPTGKNRKNFEVSTRCQAATNGHVAGFARIQADAGSTPINQNSCESRHHGGGWLGSERSEAPRKVDAECWCLSRTDSDSRSCSRGDRDLHTLGDPVGRPQPHTILISPRPPGGFTGNSPVPLPVHRRIVPRRRRGSRGCFLATLWRFRVARRSRPPV